MTTQINYDKKVNKFFSEVLELPISKKLDFKQFSFIIFLGGKNFGKSYRAFQEMINFIKKGELVAYMRNSVNEIKQIKNTIANMILNETQYDDGLSVSDEGIVHRKSGKVLVTFISVKNYNKISGNQTPYAMLFYDEFNQNLTKEMGELLLDFFSILSTIFRTNKWNVWCCGNTKTKNNIIYNLFKLNLNYISHNLEIINIDDYILIYRYQDSLFKHLNMDSKDLAAIKKYNPVAYRTMIKGDQYDKEDELVINDVSDYLKQFKITDKIIIYHNRIYNLYSFNDDTFIWIQNENLTANISVINELHDANFKIFEIELEYKNINQYVQSFQDDYLSFELLQKMKQQKLYFNDFALYLAFKDDDRLSMYKQFKPLAIKNN